MFGVAPGPTEGLKIGKPSGLKDGDVLYAFLTKNDDGLVKIAGGAPFDYTITGGSNYDTLLEETLGHDESAAIWRQSVATMLVAVGKPVARRNSAITSRPEKPSSAPQGSSA